MTVTLTSDSVYVQNGLNSFFVAGVDIFGVEIKETKVPNTTSGFSYSLVLKTREGIAGEFQLAAVENYKEWNNGRNGAIQAMNTIMAIRQACCPGGGGSGVTSVDGDTGPAVILPNFIGDSGAGGVRGYVPAPAIGDAAAGKVLGAVGTWIDTGTGDGDVVGPVSSVTGNVPQYADTTGKLIDGGLGISTGGNGVVDDGKIAIYGTEGQINASSSANPAVSAITTSGAMAFYGEISSASGPAAEFVNRNTGPIAHFHDITALGLEVLTDGGLNWTSGTGAQTTTDNLASSIRGIVLTGLSLVTATAITAADSILVAFGKLQAQITALASNGRAITIRTYTGTTDTLLLTDAGNMVRGNNAGANTCTVPPNASVAFPIGTQILFSQYGAGQMTIAAGGGVTINSYGTALKLIGRYAQALITKVGTDEWTIDGNLTT